MTWINLLTKEQKKLNQNNTNNGDKISTPPPKPEASEPRVVQEGFDVRNLDDNQKWLICFTIGMQRNFRRPDRIKPFIKTY